MRNIFILLFLFIITASGCGKTASDARSSDDFAAKVKTNPELLDIDVQLDTLEAETQALEESYASVQGTILSHSSFNSTDNTDEINVYVNENSALLVNGTAMSKNDFTNFIDKALPKACSPSPRISIHKHANYDIALWAMEEMYAKGCNNVIVE